jgi:DNA recombination-dependent growth factor C
MEPTIIPPGNLSKEANKQAAMRYYYKNRELILAKRKEQRVRPPKTPDQIKEAKEKQKEYMKEYYAKNKDKLKEQIKNANIKRVKQYLDSLADN